MKSLPGLFLLTLVVLVQSCALQIKLADKVFSQGDSIKVSSISFLDDNLCIYKQEYLIDVPQPYNEIRNVCSYSIIKKNLVLKNLTSDNDSIDSPCFQIPQEILGKIDFFIPNASDSIIVIGAPPRLSRIDIYGYLDNITIDTLKLKRNKIIYPKVNKCFPHFMVTSTTFMEIKK